MVVWVDGLRFYALFLVISGRWEADNDRRCAIEPRLQMKGFPPPGIKLGTARPAG